MRSTSHLRAAFDTVANQIRLPISQKRFPVQFITNSRFESYFTGRRQFVCINNDRSGNTVATYGVLQRSIFGSVKQSAKDTRHKVLRFSELKTINSLIIVGSSTSSPFYGTSSAATINQGLARAPEAAAQSRQN
jgi:hypothetical protein